MSPRRLGVLALAALTVAATAAHAALACAPAPLLGCRTAELGNLQMQREATDPGRNRLRWQWKNGRATLTPGFGSPTIATTQALCLYDARGLVLTLTVPPGGDCEGRPCWTERPGKGFAFKDNAVTHDGVQRLTVDASTADKAKIRLDGKGGALPAPPLPMSGAVTAQLVNDTSGACFESVLDAATVHTNDAERFAAKIRRPADSTFPPLPSRGCGSAVSGYAAGANHDTLVHDGLTRSFGVYLPPAYDLGGEAPTPIVLLFHGGFGSGDQVFASARAQELADGEGIVVVSPDGVVSPAGIRTWNAGGCCGYAVTQDVDDVGFVAAVLDRLEQSLCLDLRRIYATGMSNGAMLSYRLGCELSARIAAIGPVAGSDMTAACPATRPVPVMHVHGTADMNVPWEGGVGCGVAGVPYVGVEDSIGGWITRNACKGAATPYLSEGDGRCEQRGNCPSGADVVLCAILGADHSWPGGTPSGANLPGCPPGTQSTTFDATRNLYEFFRQHPLR